MKVNIGDVLTCVNDDLLKGNDKKPNVVLGQTYNAIQIATCKCGEEHVDIGLISSLNYVTCYKCRTELPDGPHWCHSSRFKLEAF